MSILVFYNNLGEISGTHDGSCTLSEYLNSSELLEGDYAIELDNSEVPPTDKAYLDLSLITPLVKEKEALEITISKTTILAGGIEEATISNIPQGVFVTWPDGQRDEVTDGVVEFSVTQPDTYVLTFDGVKYLTEEVSIEAHV